MLCSQPSRLRNLLLLFLLLEPFLYSPKKDKSVSPPEDFKKSTHQIFLTRPLPFLPALPFPFLPFCTRTRIPFRQLLLPCPDIEIKLTHPLSAVVLGEVRRVARIWAGKLTGAGVEFRCESWEGGGESWKGRGGGGGEGGEGRIEVGEGRVDASC